MKNIFFFPILIFCSIHLKLDAQNLRFSQFQNVPLELNPALTGSEDGGRLIANYHYQHGRILRGGGYQSIFFSYDDTKVLKNGDKVGFGGMTSFEFGEENLTDYFLETIEVAALGAYHKRIASKKEVIHFLSVGFESSLGKKNGTIIIPNPNALFPANIVTKGSFLFPDFSIGLKWYSEFKSGSSIELGASLSHLNQPRANIWNPNSSLGMRTNYFALIDLKLTPKISIIPRVFLFDAHSLKEIVTGSSLKFLLNEEKTSEVEIGVNVRFINDFFFIEHPTGIVELIAKINEPVIFESTIFNLNYHHSNFSLGISYDFTDSRIGNGSQDSFETSIIYRFKKNKQKVFK